MKVLNVIHRFSPAIGGAEIWCKGLGSYLARRGIITKVATMNMYHVAEGMFENFRQDEHIRLGEYDFEDQVFIKRYELWKPWVYSSSSIIVKLLLYVFRLEKTQIGYIFSHSPNSFQLYRSLFREIKNSDIVLLYTLPYFHNLVGYFIAKIYHKKIIFVPFFHPAHNEYEKSIFFKILNNSEAVIALSEYEGKHLVQRKINAKKIHITGCCLENIELLSQNDGGFETFKSHLQDNFGINGNTQKIIFIGRKEVYKGFETLITAAKQFSEEKKIDTALFLVGPDTPDFNRIYTNLEGSENLKIINFGTVSEEKKQYLLQISDLLVLPSKFESFGIVFLDAWKYGKPVIGADFGVIPEVISGAGLLFRHGDAADLKEKMQALLCDRKLSKKLGEAGRQKIYKQYSADRIYGKVFNIVKTLYANKKILIVSNLFPPYIIGGADIVPYEQAKILKNNGFDIRVFTGKIDGFKKRFSTTIENTEFKIMRINLHQKDFDHGTYANFDKEELREKFRSELYDFAPDIVHFHNIFALSLKMIDDCDMMNIPTIMTMHDYWGICPKNILLEQDGRVCSRNDAKCFACHGDLLLDNEGTISMEARNALSIEYYNKLSLLIAPSKYLGERYIARGIAREKVRVIPNGIDVSRFQKIKKTASFKIRFGFIGQIAWHKGMENLIQAMSLLNKEERNKISLFIVGDGEKVFVNHCKQLTQGLSFIKFIGKVKNKDIGKVLSKIDILIVPSIWPELIPGTIFEAFACGIPVIGSDIGGIPELIKNNVNGFLYKYDDVHALASIIKDIIRQSYKLNDMAADCLTTVKEYDISKQVSAIIESYKKLNGKI